MKYLIASDLHGSRAAAEAVLQRFDAEKADRLILLGDLLYHGMVLMAQMGITYEDMIRELAKRHVVDHKIKQERMQ